MIFKKPHSGNHWCGHGLVRHCSLEKVICCLEAQAEPSKAQHPRQRGPFCPPCLTSSRTQARQPGRREASAQSMVSFFNPVASHSARRIRLSKGPATLPQARPSARGPRGCSGSFHQQSWGETAAGSAKSSVKTGLALFSLSTKPPRASFVNITCCKCWGAGMLPRI